MVVRLRLSRQGTRNNPFYHVVAINDSKPRDARPIEKLGEYDPIPRPLATAKLPSPSVAAQGHGEIMTSRLAHPTHTQHTLHKRLEWNADRIKHWLQLGAQPSKPVARLLDRAGLVPPGVHYKGIYRPPTAQQSTSSSPSKSTHSSDSS